MKRVLASENLVQWMKSVIPPLEYSKHKGQAGKICVIGGSKEYTGGPYFAAISALLCGADLVHVICPEEAALVIKGYSPELIVHPILCSNDKRECYRWLDKMHAVIIGPGLGRDNDGHSSELLRYITGRNIPVVIDADGLGLVANDVSVISGSNKVILTPNINESRMLFKKLVSDERSFDLNVNYCDELASKLNNVTIVAKGFNDIITNGYSSISCQIEGSPRRCGGQGDLLSGSMGVMLSWCYQSKIFSEESNNLGCEPITAAYNACMLTRLCARNAFAEKRRATTTTDMINLIGKSFEDLFST